MTAIGLPANWRDLDNSEKFAALRDSPNLVRGGILANVEVDCLEGKITDLAAQFALKSRGRTREEGYYTFKKAQEHPVTGGLDILSSHNQGIELIYVLRGATTSDGTRGIPRALNHDELRHLASLFETKANRCSAAGGPNIKAYVIVAK